MKITTVEHEVARPVFGPVEPPGVTSAGRRSLFVGVIAMQLTAVEAHELGWSIIPVKLNKRPYLKWEGYQSTKPSKDMISRWHDQFKPPAWAVVTGAISGRIILDFDGERGSESMRSSGLEPHVRTGSGSYHVYIEHPGWPVRTLNGKLKRELGARYPGLDIRADGGYAVFCGRNEAGEYVWLRDPTPYPIDALPEDLREFLGLNRPPEEDYEAENAVSELLDVALGRSATGRNDAGFWLACQLRDHGFSRDEAEKVTRTYQQRVGETNTKGQMEPYTIGEALASVGQAYGVPARGPMQSVKIVSGRNGGSGASNDGGASDPPINARPWPEAPEPEAFYGLAGDFVRIVEPHSEADPVALLSTFLVVFGNVIGRTAYFVAEADRHYTNLFTALVGASSKGRKGSSLGHIKLILSHVDETWVLERVTSGLSSGEGLIWAVRDQVEKMEPVRENKQVVGYDPVITDQGVEDKRLLCIESEFASTLRVLGREGNTLSAIIRSAWDTGHLNSLTKNSPARATDAHISITGHITKDELLRYLDSTEAGNGFGNRFLWLCVRRSKCLPEGGNLQASEIVSLVAKLKAAVDFASGVGEMRRDEDARQLWHEVYPELSEGRPGLLGAMIARAEAQVMRLACIYALLDCSAVVRIEHLKAALALWKYCEDCARFIFRDSLGDPLADELLAILRAAPEGLTRKEIYNHFGRNKASSDIGRALGVLLEHGLVWRDVEPRTEGRPAERWRALMPTAGGQTPNAQNASNALSPPEGAVNASNAFNAYAGADEVAAPGDSDGEWVEV